MERNGTTSKWVKVESSFCYEFFAFCFVFVFRICTPDISVFCVPFFSLATKSIQPNPQIKYRHCGWHFSWTKARSNSVTLQFSSLFYFLLRIRYQLFLFSLLPSDLYFLYFSVRHFFYIFFFLICLSLSRFIFFFFVHCEETTIKKNFQIFCDEKHHHHPSWYYKYVNETMNEKKSRKKWRDQAKSNENFVYATNIYWKGRRACRRGQNNNRQRAERKTDEPFLVLFHFFSFRSFILLLCCLDFSIGYCTKKFPFFLLLLLISFYILLFSAFAFLYFVHLPECLSVGKW